MELHFSPGVKGVEEEGSAPTGYGFRPASSEVSQNAGVWDWSIWEQVLGNLETVQGGKRVGKPGIRRLEAIHTSICACCWIERGNEDRPRQHGESVPREGIR